MQHTRAIKVVEPRTRGCEECLKTGSDWFHLRVCRPAGMSDVATSRRAVTRRSISTRPSIPSSRATIHPKAGAGVTSRDHDRPRRRHDSPSRTDLEILLTGSRVRLLNAACTLPLSARRRCRRWSTTFRRSPRADKPGSRPSIPGRWDSALRAALALAGAARLRGTHRLQRQVGRDGLSHQRGENEKAEPQCRSARMHHALLKPAEIRKPRQDCRRRSACASSRPAPSPASCRAARRHWASA